MKSKLFKNFSLVIIMAVFMTAFIGCGNITEKAVADTTQTSSSPAESESSVAEPSAEAVPNAESESAEADPNQFDVTPVTLTAYLDHPQLMTSNWGEDDTSKYVTEKSGVTLDTTYATNWDGTELKLMIASGDQLPDFLVTDAHGTTANILYKEKYVQPLNKLAEEFYPNFLELLPKQMNEIYSQKDGNLYCVVDWFGDAEKLATTKAGKAVFQVITINKPVWDAIGNPTMETLDDFVNVLKMVKDKNSDITFPIYFEAIADPMADRDGTNLFYRTYGGKDVVYFDNQNKLRYCATDPVYKKALAFMNRLYREKVLNPEMFTIKQEAATSVQTDKKLFAYIGQTFNWASKVENGTSEKSPIYPIPLPTSSDIPRENIQLKDNNLGIGGWHGTFISKDSKNVKRAIQYLAFRYTDDMQIVERNGIEGRGWIKAADGTPTTSPERFAMEQKDGFEKTSAIYGNNNWNHSWFTTNWVAALAEHNRLEQQIVMKQDYEINSPLAKNERIFELSRKITDEAMKVKFEQVMMVWRENIPKIILTKSDAEFNTAYDNFLLAIEGAAISDVEVLLQAQYEDWKNRLGE